MLAYNIAALTGKAFAGKLKAFATEFPERSEERQARALSEMHSHKKQFAQMAETLTVLDRQKKNG